MEILNNINKLADANKKLRELTAVSEKDKLIFPASNRNVNIPERK